MHSDTTTVTKAPQLAGISTFGFSEQYGSTARLTFQALQGESYSVHVGGNAEFLFSPPVGPATPTAPGTRTLTLSDRPELRIDPTAIMTTGSIANVSRAEVYSAEAAAGWGPLFFQGEYFWYTVDHEFGLPSLRFNGGYAEASWTVTGESRTYIPATGAYSGIIPTNPVNIYGVGVAGGQQTIYTVGLNWYVNRNIRFMFNYLHGTIEKQASAISAVNTGANFDAVAGRMQVAF